MTQFTKQGGSRCQPFTAESNAPLIAHVFDGANYSHLIPNNEDKVTVSTSGQHSSGNNSYMSALLDGTSLYSDASSFLSTNTSSLTSATAQWRPFSCSYCEKRFKRKDHLRDHERLHTGERPYVCRFCSKAFAQRCNWNMHSARCSGNPERNV